MGEKLSERHSLLMAAALCAPETAQAAWADWRTMSEVNEADNEEARILPIVAHNLADRIAVDADLSRLRGQRRHHWTLNTLRATRSAAFAGQLATLGIESMFFKGLALLLEYEDDTIRSMSDSDVLVPWPSRHEAIDAMSSLGFKPVAEQSVAAVHQIAELLPGFGFRNDSGIEIDLHWRPLHNLAAEPHHDGLLFQHRIRRELRTAAVDVPHPSHHAVLVLGHGHRVDSGAHLISLVDFVQLLRNETFDVSMFLDLAKTYQRITAVSDAVGVIRSLPPLAPRHHGASDRLHDVASRRLVPGVGERLQRAALGATPERAGRSSTAAAVWNDVTRTSLASGGPVGGLARSARVALGVKRTKDVAPQALWVASGRHPRLAPLRRTSPPVPGSSSGQPKLSIGSYIDLTNPVWHGNLLASGWWLPEADWTWSSGAEALLRIPLDIRPAVATRLVIFGSPYLDERRIASTVEFRVNGNRSVERRYGLGDPYSLETHLELNASDVATGEVDVLVIVRRPTSPSLSIRSADTRTLGFAVRWLDVRQA